MPLPDPTGGTRRRDARLDVFRGLALVSIFINHVPGTVYEGLTHRNFGFSDAAEAFVLMSGIAAGLAYSARFGEGVVSGAALWRAVAPVWARAFTLYLVHIATTLWGIGISAGAALFFGLTGMIRTNYIEAMFPDPLGVLIGLPLMLHQIGYFNILPLYIVFLLATPALILLGQRQPLVLLGFSVAVWALAGQFRLNFPSFPNDSGWFFNPLSWQLIFVLGLLTGMALRQGRRFVPLNHLLLWACGLSLVATLLWVRWPAFGLPASEGLVALLDLGVPFYIAGFDKAFLTGPRLLHILALAYVLSALPGVRRAAESRWAAPFALLGRQALPVFALGSVLSILIQALRAGLPESLALDTALIVGGLAAMLLLATARQTSLRITRAE